MRRVSFLLAFAAILISALVAYTYKLRLANQHRRAEPVAPNIKSTEDGLALQGWEYHKEDPQTNRPVVRVRARAFRATQDPSTFDLRGLALKLYDKTAGTYTYVKSENALFDVKSGVMKSEGPVSIVMNVPADKDAEEKDVLAKRVRVETSGVTYETKTFKVYTDQAATFVFPDGGGKAVGVEYDPNAKLLHLKAQISLDRFGGGPAENKMHVEAGDLTYKEAEQKIYLSPWSKLQRQTMTIQAQSSVVTLQDGVIHQIDSENPQGTDDRDGRHVDYSAEKMTALFDADGNMTQITGDKNARVTSVQQGSKTVLTADKADLQFALETNPNRTKETTESYLKLVRADGHGVAESSPVPQPGVLPAQTRILRSEHIELEMRPGGQEVQEIRTPSQAQLEFKPNGPEQTHRILDASHMRIVYGDNSYVDTFLGWNVKTHTDKPASAHAASAKKQPEGAGPSPAALTWSDEMIAKFVPNSNEIATIDQKGNFRYQEGTRTASAKHAFLEQKLNQITLTNKAKVTDNTGSATADVILMNQANGDMDATGNVLSTHAADKNQRPGTSMLDASQPMQAIADKMQTREDNTKVFYQGHVVMWQGANRISAKKIDLDRDEQTLHAVGDVVSELLDNKSSDDKSKSAQASVSAPVVSNEAPIYTTVEAPELMYNDETRQAFYTGGVKLVRNKMTITAQQMKAFLAPKSSTNSKESSLDHAFADGNVIVYEVLAGNRKRTGRSEHGEYYTKEDKVVLNGGAPEMADSGKGISKGRQLTYFSGEDHLIVEGETRRVAFTKMAKK